jgi:signal transduction histidine kinase
MTFDSVADEAVMASRFRPLRAAGLAASIAAISVLRYITGPSSSLLHELALNLYYIPILVAAYWYGVFGGLVVAAISSAAYLNRTTQIVSTYDPGRLAEIAVFHLVAVVVGLLANVQRRVNDELRASYEQIRRIDRLRTLGEVATGLAHEIRHPLASIGGAIEIIESRSKPDSPEAEFSRLAMSEVRRLDGLVWEFLRYARPHAPELCVTPFHDVVDQAVTLLRVEADRSRVTLVVERGAAGLETRMDPLQIEQVLLNVILNAIQASPAGGCVRVCDRLDADEVCIDILDQGPGIEPQHLPQIFSPFFTTREKGTGLGLAIAHRIVMSHEGVLEVADTSRNGTRFRIRLPLAGPRGNGIRDAGAVTAL